MGLSCSGSGSDAQVIDGIEWAIEHASTRTPRRPSVMSLSLGGSRSKSLNNAVARANQLGLLVVVAAGNDADDACGGSPSSEASVITVGASGMVEDVLNDNGELVDGEPAVHDEIARFSATGSCVDIFAPGVEILAAVPQLRSTHVTSIMSGTSM